MAAVQIVIGSNPVSIAEMEDAIRQARSVGMTGDALIRWNMFGGVTITAVEPTESQVEATKLLEEMEADDAPPKKGKPKPQTVIDTEYGRLI